MHRGPSPDNSTAKLSTSLTSLGSEYAASRSGACRQREQNPREGARAAGKSTTPERAESLGFAWHQGTFRRADFIAAARLWAMPEIDRTMAKNDDRRADAAQRLEELFVSYHQAVAAYARRRAPAESVEDVVAETFLVAWQRLGRVPADSPLPWLLAVARNVIGNQLRGAGRRDALNLRLQERSTVETVDPPSVQESTGHVAEVMARLGEKDREALELVGIDGLKPREAAVVLGVSSSTFHVRLHRAKRRLGSLLEEQTQTEQRPAEPSRRPLKAKENRA
jgi:RNA polymerase sigma-70 factor, ECF subfamily